MAGISRAHIPNLLTMARGLLAVMFFVAISMYEYPTEGMCWVWVAIAVFLIAAATDWADGLLARRWQVVSAFGRVMDPFCDKLLVLGAMICLAGPQFEVPQWQHGGHLISSATGLTTWMVVVMLGRELFVTSMRGVAESEGLAFGARWSGKLKMAMQSIAVPVTLGLIMLAPPTDVAWSCWTIRILMWTTVAVTVWSGLPYLAALPGLLRKAAA